MMSLPDFSIADIEILRQYFGYSETCYERIENELMNKMADHPVLGPMLKNQAAEQQRIQRRETLGHERAAIFEGKWDGFIRDLYHKGINYARLSLSYPDWFGIMNSYKELQIRDIKTCFAGEPAKVAIHLEALSKLTDYSMYIIAGAYFEEHNRISQEKEHSFNDEREKNHREITELNHTLEQKVSERTSQLEAANKELEAFSYSVAHDLRSPLRGINGYTTIIEEDYGSELGEEARRLLREIKGQALRMGMLIDDLLMFSRLGRKEMNKSLIDMNELILMTIETMYPESGCPAKVKTSKLLPAIADPSLMKLVVENLLSNAIKYSSKKKDPVVEIRSKKEDGQLIYSVKDNGVGFDMLYSKKLFDVFQRLHSDEEFEGTGVGLAIVQRIVLRHGGNVWANSREEKERLFSFHYRTRNLKMYK